MSNKGDPYDNAMIESFFSTLRAELTELQRFQTLAQARLAVFDYLFVKDEIKSDTPNKLSSIDTGECQHEQRTKDHCQ